MCCRQWTVHIKVHLLLDGERQDIKENVLHFFWDGCFAVEVVSPSKRANAETEEVQAERRLAWVSGHCVGAGCDHRGKVVKGVVCVSGALLGLGTDK